MEKGGEVMNQIAERLKNALFSLQKPSIIIALGLLVIAFIIVGYQLLFGGQQGKEQAKDTAFYAVIGIAIVAFAVEIGTGIYEIILGKGF